MNELIRIKDFACLPSMEVELKDFSLIIGPQATGKSILAKLLFYFKSVIWQIPSAAEQDFDKRDFDVFLLKRFEEFFPQQSWGKKSFHLEYIFGTYFVKIWRDYSARRDSLKIEYSRIINLELLRFRRQLRPSQLEKEQPADVTAPPTYRLREEMLDRFSAENKRIAFRQVFIPAGRSFFANLQSNIFSFLSGNNALDPFLKEFGSLYESIKRSYTRVMSRTDDNKAFLAESNALIEQLLHGKYVFEKGKDYLDVADGRRVNLSNCSSGQQETLPLVMMMQRLTSISRTRGATIYIEEPEAHLFPTSQRIVLELIVLAFNRAFPWMQIFITTHSPYVITALNNLIEAASRYNSLNGAQKAKLAKVIPKERSIALSSITAYSLTREGCSSIVDPETNLIETELIDKVSEELALQFDALLALE